MATQTANKMFNYNAVHHGKTLEEWANLAHKKMSEVYNWKYSSLARGSFGFDNMVMSIGFVFRHADLTNISEISKQVHNGWRETYIYWRDQNPALTDSDYKAPFKPLGDERRNLCAITEYCDLPKVEQEKDDIISQLLIDTLAADKVEH